MQEIAAQEQIAMGMGANDYEPAAFQQLKQRLTDGEVTPIEAVRHVELLRVSRIIICET